MEFRQRKWGSYSISGKRIPSLYPKVNIYSLHASYKYHESLVQGTGYWLQREYCDFSSNVSYPWKRRKKKSWIWNISEVTLGGKCIIVSMNYSCCKILRSVRKGFLFITVDSQCSANFWCTEKWPSHIYI